MIIVTCGNTGTTTYCKTHEKAVEIPSTVLSKGDNWLKHYYEIVKYLSDNGYLVFIDFNKTVIEYLCLLKQKAYILAYSDKSGVPNFTEKYEDNYKYFTSLKSQNIVKIPLNSTFIMMKDIVSAILEGNYEK